LAAQHRSGPWRDEQQNLNAERNGQMTLEFAEGGLRLDLGPIARLTLDRPTKRNAMTAAMWAAVPTICDRLVSERARVLIVTGSQGKAFCAGADISEFETVYGTANATAAYNSDVRDAQARLRDLPFPTIAEIGGACFGGGCGLALACDFRVAGPDALFAITPARLGLAYSPDDTWQLIEKVGMPRAKDLLLTGRTVGAQEAISIGLIDRLAEDAEGAATALADHLIGLAPDALCTIKSICNALSTPTYEPELQFAFEDTFAGAEFREGYRSFLEKRKPDFSGDKL
jgi:enoyl-CoA hydratase/carnithine racemase